MRPEDSRPSEAQLWLRDAADYLRLADAAFALDPPLYHRVVESCHAAVERLLKAALVAAGKSFARIHNPLPLLHSLQDAGVEVALDREDAQWLFDCAAQHRYPDIHLDAESLDEGEAARALAIAHKLENQLRITLADEC